MTHTRESLLAFTERVRMAFLAKKIRSPVHLCDPEQAEPLIRIFADIRPQDWVFATWRNYFHALLKGIPADEVFRQICEGRSMFVMSKEHRFMAGSIVGGMLPIALGVAAGIKQKYRKTRCYPQIAEWTYERILTGPKEGPSGIEMISEVLTYLPTVWVFVGDMAARSGLFQEFREYAMGHDLPVKIIIENNELSTDSPTDETWGIPQTKMRAHMIDGYTYRRTVPHVGVGQRVEF